MCIRDSSTIMETNVVGTRMGWSVAGGGDVDGDGFSDVLAGGPNAAPSLLDEGALYMMRGNQGRAFPQLSRQYLSLIHILQRYHRRRTLRGLAHLSRGRSVCIPGQRFWLDQHLP